MPKDNETIHLTLDGPVAPSEPAGFAPDEMIRCEECLRANPPTRFACLYCDAALPLNQLTVDLRKPSLRQPEKHQIGFNCILISNDTSLFREDTIKQAAELVKLKPEVVDSIVAINKPMPLARTASREEAQLVNDRLREHGFSMIVLSDEDLGRDDTVVRIRSLQFDDTSLSLRQSAAEDLIKISWSEVRLMISGRLITQKVEVTERVSRRPETEILNTSEFFSDEPVFDLYSSTHDRSWRIGSNSFDFSCLQEQKSFIAAENLKKLQGLICARSTNLDHDSGYNELRNALQAVWPLEQETYSRGWRRERPGKYSLGAVTASTNHTQFTRYSLLRRYFMIKS